MPKAQRMRDSVHSLIGFDEGEFEQTAWKIINTRPMQRLRRIKQLGFSEFVYPGACHSRFAHSVGVFHTARELIDVVKKRLGPDRFNNNSARMAMSAALVHDVGHGPFSHAFEDALKNIGLSKRHELRTRKIILDTDMYSAFEEFPEFPESVASLIEAEYPKDIYSSIISSQFDADRLDYMRRDRLMSGTQQSGIDYDWLIANLHVHRVPIQLDDERISSVEAFVIDEKSLLAAEGYIFSLFYLYRNVYFHKTTRGLEKVFSLLIERIAHLIRDDCVAITGLPRGHPLVKFIVNPDDMEAFIQLDDTVIIGSLSMLVDSEDGPIRELAGRIRDRRIYTCFDVTKWMTARFGRPVAGGTGVGEERERAAAVAARVARVGELAIERSIFAPDSNGVCGVLEDTAPRSPYKRVYDGARPLSRIHVIGADGNLHDLADLSPAVNALSDFSAYRLYARSDSDRQAVEKLLEDASR